jgi:hypothetical protein
MRKLFCPVFLLLAATAVFAQMGGDSQPQTVTSVLESQFSNAERQFTSAADAMPEDKYSFAPTQGQYEGVRTFGQLISHTATANYRYCSTILGESAPVELGGTNGPANLKSKDQIVKFLKDSNDYCHKAYASINEKNMLEPIKGFMGGRMTSRLDAAVGNIAHVMDEYGQVVEYLRMNGVVPPATARRQRR